MIALSILAGAVALMVVLALRRRRKPTRQPIGRWLGVEQVEGGFVAHGVLDPGAFDGVSAATPPMYRLDDEPDDEPRGVKFGDINDQLKFGAIITDPPFSRAALESKRLADFEGDA